MNQPFKMPEVLAREDAVPSEARRTSRRRMLWRVMVLSALLGVAIGAVIFLVFFRESMTALTRENLQAARQKWEAAGVSHYDLILETHPPGQNEPLRFTVRVRYDRIADILQDGRPSETREPESYAIVGLFDMLERELDLAESPDSPLKMGGGKVFQRVRFHDELGYPEHYLRVVGGSNQNSRFTILSLTPVEP